MRLMATSMFAWLIGAALICGLLWLRQYLACCGCVEIFFLACCGCVDIWLLWLRRYLAAVVASIFGPRVMAAPICGLLWLRRQFD